MNVELLVVPFDTGVRGWRMGAGPEHLLRAGLEDRLRSAGRSVTSSVIVPARDGGAEIATAFELMANLATAVRGAIEAGRFPLGSPAIATPRRERSPGFRSVPRGLLVRRPRRLQHTRDHDERLPRRLGPRDRDGLVLAQDDGVDSGFRR